MLQGFAKTAAITGRCRRGVVILREFGSGSVDLASSNTNNNNKFIRSCMPLAPQQQQRWYAASVSAAVSNNNNNTSSARFTFSGQISCSNGNASFEAVVDSAAAADDDDDDNNNNNNNNHNDDDDDETSAASIDDASSATKLTLNAVVKIFTTSRSPDYFSPWQMECQEQGTGSGFVISDKKILTNAHVVADHKFVQVQKHNCSTMYKAEVQAVGHECDLATLTVESEEFWEGLNSLPFGDIPFLREAVSVFGYPWGGHGICITQGIVSRIESIEYVHGGTHLLAIQIDATISPGNSGGPVLMGSKVVGVAFQGHHCSESIGYIIPVPIINHFLAAVGDRGNCEGICNLGLKIQTTRSSQLRKHFHMRSDKTGVLVIGINPLSDAYRVLKKHDIILAFDGVPIGYDGEVPFRSGYRVKFDHLVSMKKPNETAQVKVLRNGEEHVFSITVRPLQRLVPIHQLHKLPSYFIYGGLVFTPLTQPYIDVCRDDSKFHQALKKLPTKAGEQIVIISQVLIDDINVEYENLDGYQVKTVNGRAIDNLRHLRELVEGCGEEEEDVRFEIDGGRVIVLNNQEAKLATPRILETNGISSAVSNDLLLPQNNNLPDVV